ncbi:MAG: class I SAM-dependent methyltransferase [Acidimicrobiia bacterium]|nr:class I SAM-dependent methyltransferase [Acidimicrobiia bacterium]
MDDALSDRDRWNARYIDVDDVDGAPGALAWALPHLPTVGSAIDVAGGRGGAACVLASRGLDTTLAEISSVAIEMAEKRAARSRLTLATIEVDLQHDPFPLGPWDVICCFHYLHRPLFAAMANALVPGGILVAGIATRTNLERNERPSARFLLDDGELLTLVPELEVVDHEEGWNDGGSHEARLVARKPR